VGWRRTKGFPPYWHLMSLLLLAVVQVGCGGLPKSVERAASTAFSRLQETSLGRELEEQNRQYPDQTGIVLLDRGRDAFRYRVALLRAAERSIDLQYFIWNDDRSGNFMAARLLEAAERGVRVRLLLDDFHAVGNDLVIPALNAHPNIQVRAYNPFTQRRGFSRWLELLADFQRLNRRMHDKALLVDGAAAIIGGRNIGDEYFDLREDRAFLDRELLVTGTVVPDIGRGFDAYWNSAWSYPLENLIGHPAKAANHKALTEILRERQQPDINTPADRSQALAMIHSAAGSSIRAQADLVIDRVPDADTPSDGPKEVALRLAELIEQTHNGILIESAYLVMGDQGVSMIDDAVQRDVRVRILTNSLASNDLVPNHAAYVGQRPAMLQTGLELHELMPQPETCAELATEARACAAGVKLGLHTKSVVFDGSASFIGSFNLNMRSVYLNTEMGLLVHSPELARCITSAFRPKIEPGNSWRVTLDDDGKLLWSGHREGRERHYVGEPEAPFWQSFSASFLSLFPTVQYF